MIGLVVFSSRRDHPNEVQEERGLVGVLPSQAGLLAEFLCGCEACLKEGKKGQPLSKEALGLL